MRELAVCLFIALGLMACTPKDDKQSVVSSDETPSVNMTKSEEGASIDEASPVLDSVEVNQAVVAGTEQAGVELETMVEKGRSQNPLATLSEPSDMDSGLRQKILEANKMETPIEQETLLTGQLEVSETRQKNGNLQVVLLVHNPKSHGVYLEFRSGMSADLALFSAGKPIWKWSDDMMFTQAINYQTIKAGESAKYGFSIPKAVLSDLKQKRYQLRADFKGVATEMNEPTINPIYGELLRP